MRVKNDFFLEGILCGWQWSISKVLGLVKKTRFWEDTWL
jgi:hypothetical protein